MLTLILDLTGVIPHKQGMDLTRISYHTSITTTLTEPHNIALVKPLKSNSWSE